MPSHATDREWQREQRRRLLLQCIGVQPLISRSHIGGAATPRLLEPPVVAGVEGVGIDETHGRSVQTAVKPTIEKAPLRSPIPRSSTTAAVSVVAAAESEAVSFSLLIASTGPFLWVEHLPDALISREQLLLLQSIAVAVVGGDTQLGHRQFDWPLAKAPQLPKDLGTARQSVAGHLTRWAQQQTAQTLMVCGESAREFVTEIPGLSQLFIPSLRDMLTTPALKRTAWQHLRPLTKQ